MSGFFQRKTFIFFVRRSSQVELEYFGAALWAKLPTTGKCSTCIQENEKYIGIYAQKHRVSSDKYNLLLGKLILTEKKPDKLSGWISKLIS